MTEWWTYRPSDFLMFAPRTWWRLFELHNQASWPAQPLVLLAALLGLAVLARQLRRVDPGPALPGLRLGGAALAAAWAWVGWAFVLQRYAAINLAATGLAALFFIQALLLAAFALFARFQPHPNRLRRATGIALCGAALLAYPLLAPAFGRPWTQAEVFGLAPDPTVIATLGWLLLTAPRNALGRGLEIGLWTLALAACAISAATLWTLGSAQGGVPAAAALLALAAARRRASPA